ncbi:hypothetical protein [Halorubrum halodurans]|uniref:hypothetical protein n=1 Tax=Halorubrum halodurans TaxID=1383851 RepID=UPI00117B93CA|nr:hypothetical protein [Halorubrum halodurans]
MSDRKSPDRENTGVETVTVLAAAAREKVRDLRGAWRRRQYRHGRHRAGRTASKWRVIAGVLGIAAVIGVLVSVGGTVAGQFDGLGQAIGMILGGAAALLVIAALTAGGVFVATLVPGVTVWRIAVGVGGIALVNVLLRMIDLGGVFDWLLYESPLMMLLGFALVVFVARKGWRLGLFAR